MRIRTMAAIAAAGAVAVMLGACGSSSSSSSQGAASSSSGSNPAAASRKTLKMAYIVGQKGIPFYDDMLCGAQAEAKTLNVSLTTSGPSDWSAPEQEQLLNAAIDTSPNAILIVPTDPVALNGPLSQAKGTGVKVITTDTLLKSGSNIASAAITAANVAGGAEGADALAKMIGYKGTVATFSNPPGTSTTDLRIQGFVQEMKKKYPQIKLLPTQYNDTTPLKSQSQMSATLEAHPDLAGAFAPGDDSALGVATAIRNADKGAQVRFVAFDPDPALVDGLKAGTVSGLLAQQPGVEGKDAVQYAVDALEGKGVPPLTLLPNIFITKASLNTPASQAALYKSTC